MKHDVAGSGAAQTGTTRIGVVFLTVFAIYGIWHALLRALGQGIPNLDYLKYGAIALSVVWLSKLFMLREQSSFSALMGELPDQRGAVELAGLLLLCVGTGIGAWTVLVLGLAHFDLEWTYRHFGLVEPAVFERARFAPSWLLAALLCSVILVPITEELIFRGLVLRRLRARYSTRVAIVLSALIFALVHVNKSFLGSFMHGIIFAVLAVKYRSLYLPMLLHGLYNGAVFGLRTWSGFSLSVEKNSLTSVAFWTPELLAFLVSLLTVIFYLYSPDKLFPMSASRSRTPAVSA